MPPPLALALTLLFIAYLFRREFRQEYTPSIALSIPCIYLLILGSRSVTAWVNLGQPIAGYDIEEGSPLDRSVFLLLITAGLVVLLNRHISWSQVFRENIWLTFFVFYCGISILWSDLPFVAFKRWTKGFGDPIIMLIILTDGEPIKAVQFVFKTCIYLLIPLSVLFIKYYPHLGRAYDGWTGAAMNTGVTTNKNTLGFVLMVSGLFLVWKISARCRAGSMARKWLDEVGIPILLLCMVAWLVQMANSKTSLMGLVLGIFVYFGLGLRNVRTHIGSYFIAGILTFLVMQVSFDLMGVLIQGAGRDPTLTGRTELWDVVLSMQQEPLLGYGFESFWLGDRLMKLQNMWAYGPTQAHNGYIEVYLNLGCVGLFILGGVIVSCYRRIREMLASSWEVTERVSFGRFGMAFLAMYIVYNYTEAAFKSLHFLYLVFLLFAIKSPQSLQRIAPSSIASFPRGVQKVPRVTGVGDLSLSPSAMPGSPRNS